MRTGLFTGLMGTSIHIGWRSPERGPRSPEERCVKCGNKGLPGGCPICSLKA